MWKEPTNPERISYSYVLVGCHNIRLQRPAAGHTNWSRWGRYSFGSVGDDEALDIAWMWSSAHALSRHVNASSCGQFAWFLLYQGKKSKWSFNPSFKRSLARIRRAMRVVGNMTAIEFSLVSMAWWRWCYAHPPKLPTSTQSRACLGTGCFPDCLAEFMTLFWWFETIGYCSKHDTTAQ